MTTTSTEQTKPSLVSLFARFRELALIAFILLLVALISLRNPNFLTFTNFKDILMDISVLTMVALAQGMIIITRGIDLSVASMLGLVAMMVGFVLKAYPETPIVLIVLLGMALGAALGSANGLIITVGRVPPIIATLGTLSIYRGLVFLYSNGTWINAFEMPAAFKQLAKGTPFGLPNLVIVALVVAAHRVCLPQLHPARPRHLRAGHQSRRRQDFGRSHGSHDVYGLRHCRPHVRTGRRDVGLAL